ncbi:abortive infection AbiH-like protein [Chryseobacterium sp. CBTAP 102]|uniref:AbiH family protein n=1 Tax=Chryseobacterium sp. CBTAP 102 TaxID=2135644 RepID=UPI000D752003|nr:AbiH family protein [Chryseobacterium sp. CBTAP 102]PXW14686.1 abortive infection AbiH-like protein [Chryseobacterium sp. CBTAP 102]
MNRLIIVGNGFDLAHGLPTSYSSFLNFIWQEFHQTTTNPLFMELFEIDEMHLSTNGLSYQDYKDFCSKMKFNYRSSNYMFKDSHYGSTSFNLFYRNTLSFDEDYKKVFSFKNKFFELITVRQAINWVDIENSYYQVLISLITGEGKYMHIGTVKQLNEEFTSIKNLLEYYLTEKIEKKYQLSTSYSHCESILSLFEYKFKNLKSQYNEDNPFYLEFPPDYRKKLEDFDYLFSEGYIDKSNSAYENLFLDFNYTSNVENYVTNLNFKNSRFFGESSHIQIHGQLNDVINPINFGFGDEMDDHYKFLENTNDNDFLENIKSFMYLNNSNYRKLLNWIEADDYQIYIMGHSCGLSDRTLLNTLFEHNNCKSIKIFYYKGKDGSDNFKELSQNISRHFNKKSLMRQKVVDKTLSLPLPQNVRYDKKTI